jgi:hypothetical protein
VTNDSIGPWETLLALSKRIMADGLIKGEPFGETISYILLRARTYGWEEAHRSGHFFASVNHTDYDDLKRDMVLNAVEGLFDKTPLTLVIQRVCTAGAAFGFQDQKAEIAKTAAKKAGKAKKVAAS